MKKWTTLNSRMLRKEAQMAKGKALCKKCLQELGREVDDFRPHFLEPENVGEEIRASSDIKLGMKIVLIYQFSTGQFLSCKTFFMYGLCVWVLRRALGHRL